MFTFFQKILVLLLISITFIAGLDGGEPKKPKKYKYQLAICAIFRNEAPYLKEWIEFHRLLGVEKFYLYNNLSTDHYKEVLKPYIKKRIVDLTDWTYNYQDISRWSPIQCSAYYHAILRISDKVKWLAILDLDEFLFPTKSDNLMSFLKDYENFGTLCVNWQMFGTSHVQKIPADKLLIETMSLRAPRDYEENRLVKSIVRPDRVKTCESPHFCFLLPPYEKVNENKEPFSGADSPYVSVNKIRINHYWSRDEDFFYNVKVGRRQSWQEGYDALINRVNNLNVERDEGSILRFAPALRKKVFAK